MNPLELSGAPSVERWVQSASQYTGPHLHEERLQVLEAFCAHADMTPDELVEFCFLRKRATGERFVSVKRRMTVNEWLEQFVADQGWADKEAVQKANMVRSFLIHNGVLIQGSVWRGG